MKPLQFKAKMAQAVLHGRKTVTRRLVNPQPGSGGIHLEQCQGKPRWRGVGRNWRGYGEPGEIRYVPEAWKMDDYKQMEDGNARATVRFRDGETVTFTFDNPGRAEKWQKYNLKSISMWQSPYFMPKEAARIFVRINNVRVERLQDIDRRNCLAEGIYYPISDPEPFELEHPGQYEEIARSKFAALWDSTLTRKQEATDSWLANPWVWVVEFERISREEALAS